MMTSRPFPYSGRRTRRRGSPAGRPPARRRGALMVCVLACLAVVASLVAWIARDAVQARRETRVRLQLLQTERLLDAGILRAAKRSQADATYEGETWKPSVSPWSESATAVVTIEINDSETRVNAKIDSGQQITSKSYIYTPSEIQ